MESKALTHESFAVLHSRPKRVALHLDPSSFKRRVDDELLPDSSCSSPRSATLSPESPVATRSISAGGAPDTGDIKATKAPASGPQRARSSTVSSTKGEKEKRKRSRVTPDQLVHLERFFSVDRSPTANRRREISELLNMQERQTQIWFQNRRAKAKLQDGKNKGRSGSAETPPDTPPELSAGFEADLHNLIHEDEPVTIIPCTDLSIGTWRRIATTVGKHDLVAYVCDNKRCITWFIYSGGYGFKMEIPFDHILDTEFTNAAPGSGLASFMLSQPPIFYLENVSSPRTDGTIVREWKRCADWTEDQQATRVLRHDLIGSAVQLAHVLRNLNASTPGSDIHLHSPTYTSPVEPPPTPMELPQPPLAGLTGPGFRLLGDSEEEDHHVHIRKRSYSGPPMTSHHSSDNDFPSIQEHSCDNKVHGPSFTSSFPHSSDQSHRIPSSSSYASPMFSDFSGPDSPQNTVHHPHSPLSDYGAANHSQGAVPRPYSAQPVPRSFYSEPVSPYHIEGPRRHSSASASLSHAHFHHTPSPPLLTTPYHPQPHITGDLTDGHSPSTLNSSPPLISSLTGVHFDADDDVHHRGDDMS